jgi:hypothetical protein
MTRALLYPVSLYTYRVGVSNLMSRIWVVSGVGLSGISAVFMPEAPVAATIGIVIGASWAIIRGAGILRSRNSG